MVVRIFRRLQGILFALILLGATSTGLLAQPDPATPKKESIPLQPRNTEIEVKVQLQGQPAAGVRVWIEESDLGAEGFHEIARPNPAKENTIRVVGPQKTPSNGTVLFSVNANASVWYIYAQDENGHLGMAALVGNVQKINSIEHKSFIGDERIILDIKKQQKISGKLIYKSKPFSDAYVTIVTFRGNIDSSTLNSRRFSLIHCSSSLKGIVQTQKVGADGTFSLDGVPEGLVAMIEIRKEGLGSGIVSVRAGALEEKIDVRLGGGLAISVEGADRPRAIKVIPWDRLTDENGNPPEGRQPTRSGNVYLHPEKTIPFFRDLTVPCVVGDDPGVYRLAIREDLTEPDHVGFSGKVVIEPGKTTKLVLKKSTLKTLTGRILDAKTGKGVPDLVVQLKGTQKWHEGLSQGDQPYDETVDAKTNQDGEYIFRCIGNCIYTIQFGGINNNRRVPSLYEFPYWDSHSKKLIPDVPHMKMENVDHYRFPDITLRPLRVVTGVVKNDDGQPANAPFQVFCQASGTRSVSKADKFTLRGVAESHPFKIFVRKGTAVNDPTTISLSKEDKPLDFIISEKNQISCKGKIVDAEGNPIPQALVNLNWKFESIEFTNKGCNPRWRKIPIDTIAANKDGDFEAKGLWPGEVYYIEAFDQRIKPSATPRMLTTPSWESIDAIVGRSAKRGETIDFGRFVLQKPKEPK